MRLIEMYKRELLRLTAKLTNVVVLIDTSTHLDHHIKLRAEFYSDLPCFLLNWMAVHDTLWTTRITDASGQSAIGFGRQRGHQKT